MTDLQRKRPNKITNCEEPAATPLPMALCEEARNIILLLLKQPVWIDAASVVLPKLCLKALKYFDHNV